jgi:hypothetical protein
MNRNAARQAAILIGTIAAIVLALLLMALAAYPNLPAHVPQFVESIGASEVYKLSASFNPATVAENDGLTAVKESDSGSHRAAFYAIGLFLSLLAVILAAFYVVAFGKDRADSESDVE